MNETEKDEKDENPEEKSRREGASETSEGREEFRVYKQRWAVLSTVALLNISNAALWINTAPVSYDAAEYFEVTLNQINWFSLVFLFVSIPFCFISTFSVNKLGLKTAIHIGSALNCIGGVIRALSTADFVPRGKAQYPISLTGQVIAGMAQSFILFIPTKVSQLWFPDSARAVSTSILSLSNPVGILITLVISPLIVREAADMPILNYVFGGLAIVTQAVTIICITRSKPRTPPSKSAEREESHRATYCQQLKTTFTCIPYLLLLLAIGCGVAVFSALATVAAQLLCPLGYTNVFSSIAMGILILCGIFGSAFTGIMVDRTKQFTPIIKLCYGLAGIAAIIMLELFMVPDIPAVVAVACGVFGFFGVGAYPIGLELAVETTYPVEESISTAFIFMSGQVQGAVIIAMVTALSRDLQPKYKDIQVCTSAESDIQPRDYTISIMCIMILLTLVVVLLIVFFKTPYKRLDAERVSSNSSLSNSSSNRSRTPTGNNTERLDGPRTRSPVLDEGVAQSSYL